MASFYPKIANRDLTNKNKQVKKFLSSLVQTPGLGHVGHLKLPEWLEGLSAVICGVKGELTAQQVFTVQ